MWVQQADHRVEYTPRVSISRLIYGYNPCRIDVPTNPPFQTRVRVNAVIGWGERDDWTWDGITQCDYGRKWGWMTITVSGGFRISQMGRGNNNPWISGKNLYLARYMLKTAWKWKKWTDRGRVSLDPPPDPPMVKSILLACRRLFTWVFNIGCGFCRISVLYCCQFVKDVSCHKSTRPKEDA